MSYVLQQRKTLLNLPANWKRIVRGSYAHNCQSHGELRPARPGLQLVCLNSPLIASATMIANYILSTGGNVLVCVRPGSRLDVCADDYGRRLTHLIVLSWMIAGRSDATPLATWFPIPTSSLTVRTNIEGYPQGPADADTIQSG